MESWAITQADWEGTARQEGCSAAKLCSKWSLPEVKLAALWKLASPLPSTRSWISAHWGNWEVTVKTYHSDLIWFYNRLLWFKKAAECQRQRKMRLKLFRSGADCREWLTKIPLMLPHLTCIIPITFFAAVFLFTSRVKLSLALQIDCAFPVPYDST